MGFRQICSLKYKMVQEWKEVELFPKIFFWEGPNGIFLVSDDIWPIFGRKIQNRPNLLMHASKKIFQNRFFSIFEILPEMSSKLHIWLATPPLAPQNTPVHCKLACYIYLYNFRTSCRMNMVDTAF